METYKDLSSKLSELAAIRNVTFGTYNLQNVADFNTTVLLDMLTKQMENLKKGYEGYSLQLWVWDSNSSNWSDYISGC